MDVTSSERYLVSPFVSELWMRIPPYARSGKARVPTEIVLAVQLGVDPAHIVERAEAYYKSHQGRGEYRMKIKNFIANGCYDDDDEAWQERKPPRAADSSPVYDPPARDPRLPEDAQAMAELRERESGQPGALETVQNGLGQVVDA